ncbi:MAG: hypothetical protein SFX73_03740 [Kofleriaceae bacterium]|nr:hypothetical protein [Kofleriaceae bacterium]
MSNASLIDKLKDQALRVGYARALEASLYEVVNKYVCLRRLEIIHLSRERLEPLELVKTARLSSRIATERELLAMRGDSKWSLGDELLSDYRAGDRCLLSFVDDKPAGYTWVHTRGRPKIFQGLYIEIPPDHLYNYAGYTLPEFRGYGLQPYRHHAVLNQPEWRDRKGMIGFVQAINWSSRRGQSKSGYRKLGTILLVGTNRRFSVHLSRELEPFGIRRIDA